MVVRERERERDRRLLCLTPRGGLIQSRFLAGGDTCFFLRLTSLHAGCFLNDWRPHSSCYSIIFSTSIHFCFRFSIYVIHFHSSLFTQVQYPVWNPWLFSLSKVHIYIYIYMCVCVCVYVRVHVFVCANIYSKIYIYIYIYNFCENILFLSLLLKELGLICLNTVKWL